MESQESVVSFAKKIAVLEAQCDQLKEDRIKLKEQELEVKGKKEEMIEKYEKMRDKYSKVREEFGSVKMKWLEEEEILRENCRQEWVAKRKLEIDLKAAKRRLTNSSVEVAQKLLAMDRHFQSLLEESNGRITTLLAKNEALERRNSKLEPDLELRKMREQELYKTILDLKSLCEEEKRKIREESNCRIATLFAKNEALIKHNSMLEMSFEARLVMEAKRQATKNEGKILEHLKVLEREKVEFKAENNKKDDLITKLEEEAKVIKGMETMLREKFEERSKQVSSLSGEIEASERRNSKLESDLELARMRAKELEKALLDLKSSQEIEKRKIREESNCTIASLLAKNEALDKRSSILETEFEARMAIEAKKQETVTEEKILVLLQKIEVLEREKEAEKRAMEVEGKKKVSELTLRIEDLEEKKRENEAKFCSVNREKSEAAMKVLNEKTAVEAEKRTLEAETKKKDELIVKLKEEVKAIKGMEKILREKFEAGERKWSEEARKVEEKCRRSEADKRRLDMDLEAALKDKMTVEADKEIMEAESKTKVSKLVLRIEVLEQEKRELEAEVCEAKREKSEEIKLILNEKINLKEKHTKEIIDLVLKSGILDRENQRLKAEIKEKDEMIKLLVPEKEESVVKKKKMVINMNKCVVKQEKGVKLQQVHPASNVSISCPPTTQHQGPNSIDVSVAEQKDSSDGGMRLSVRLGKRKVEELRCSVVNQAGMKGCKLEGLTECKLVWKNAEGMLNAFTNNDELCMRAICALYRKYYSLGVWKDLTRSTRFRGFSPPYETRGMALGKLLTSGDPEGKLKMSLAELEQSDPPGLEDCRLIAKHNHKVLFEIYKKALDPLFMSIDDMN